MADSENSDKSTDLDPLADLSKVIFLRQNFSHRYMQPTMAPAAMSSPQTAFHQDTSNDSLPSAMSMGQHQASSMDPRQGVPTSYYKIWNGRK